RQPVLLVQFRFRPLLVVDVGQRAEPLDDPSLQVAHRKPTGQEPTVHAVGAAADAVLDVGLLPGLKRPAPGRKDPGEVVGVDGGYPLPAAGLLQPQAGVAGPELVDVIDPAVGPGGPDDGRDEVGQGTITFFAGAQGGARLL